MTIIFNKLKGFDYICQVPNEVRMKDRAKINIWLRTIDQDGYMVAEINSHLAYYFHNEDDAVTFKLKFCL